MGWSSRRGGGARGVYGEFGGGGGGGPFTVKMGPLFGENAFFLAPRTVINLDTTVSGAFLLLGQSRAPSSPGAPK